MHISLTEQMQQVRDTYEQLELSLGEAAAADLFAKSIFYISIGSNDFIHYYFRNTTNVRSLFLPWEFNQLLVDTIKHELKVFFFTLTVSMSVILKMLSACDLLILGHGCYFFTGCILVVSVWWRETHLLDDFNHWCDSSLFLIKITRL